MNLVTLYMSELGKFQLSYYFITLNVYFNSLSAFNELRLGLRDIRVGLKEENLEKI